ncbi:MAG: ATP-binding cassette domain-containing protein [Defluviitaleaceae bacterium]|nr:ATP-binding cassette domain-containing protein [Defluviitaleaceae bacterium]
MAIELKGICKSFGEPPVAVLENISMTFTKGITCIMGQSGIGKTTLVNILAGLVPPDKGEIIGRDGKKISMVFQEDRLLNWESAISNVMLVTTAKDRDRAIKLLTEAGLSESLNKKAAELSGGMKRRVCLCRALISSYDILILDEPFKGLDNTIKPAIIEMVKTHATGIIICITHDPTEAEILGGKVITL